MITDSAFHVMHVIDSLAVGGAERMLVDIANTIDEREFKISVCVTRSGQVLARELNPNIPLKFLGRKFRFDFNGFRGLRKFSEEQKVDLFHAHGRSTFSLLLAARIFGFIDQPIILHDHFGDIEFDQSTPYWFANLGIRYISHYIAVSPKLAAWALKAGIPKEKITVVQNSLDLERIISTDPIDLHTQLSIPKDQKICITVGNLRSAKGLDLLIEVCDLLPREILPVFVIVGRDADQTYADACRKRIEENGLTSYFRFTGRQESSIPWIKGANFGIIPSRSESGPLILIEIMACGLPFVAFNVGGISQQVSLCLPESFARPDDIHDFAQKLMRLLETPQQAREALSHQNKELASRLFDVHHRVPEITTIYRSILMNKQ